MDSLATHLDVITACYLGLLTPCYLGLTCGLGPWTALGLLALSRFLPPKEILSSIVAGFMTYRAVNGDVSSPLAAACSSASAVLGVFYYYKLQEDEEEYVGYDVEQKSDAAAISKDAAEPRLSLSLKWDKAQGRFVLSRARSSLSKRWMGLIKCLSGLRAEDLEELEDDDAVVKAVDSYDSMGRESHMAKLGAIDMGDLIVGDSNKSRDDDINDSEIERRVNSINFDERRPLRVHLTTSRSKSAHAA